ncbi:MAG: carbonic anhydrase family protein [Parvibaculum sp.]|nr:carbonic anhydrase family protein [Parvibaculum sp.]
MGKFGEVRGVFVAGCMAAVVLAAFGVHAEEGGGEHPAWDYGDVHGPEHWADIDPAFATCRTGMRQSPIDISGPAARDGAAPSLALDYRAGAATVVNLGHTLQVNVAAGNRLTLGGVDYQLLQFHVHTPSEHSIDGRHSPMEAHLVHRNADGGLAVVGVLIDAGAAGVIDELPLPDAVGGTAELDAALDPSHLLPAARGFHAFEGSLTTPPCSEGVQWIVMRAPATASEETIARITAVLGPTNRPVHPLNGREVLTGE